MSEQQPLVVSNIGLVLDGFINILQAYEPLMKYVYDEKLSYETGMKKFRSDNLASGQSFPNPYPLFIFNRSVLRHTPDGASRRHTVSQAGIQLDGGQAQAYKFVHGEIDVKFLFVANEASRVEDFEISFLSQESFAIKDGREFSVSMPDIGDYKYFVKYSGVLEDKIFEDNGVYYKAISSSVTIRGFYFVVKGVGPVITQINLKVQNFLDSVLFTQQITSP